MLNYYPGEQPGLCSHRGPVTYTPGSLRLFSDNNLISVIVGLYILYSVKCSVVVLQSNRDDDNW